VTPRQRGGGKEKERRRYLCLRHQSYHTFYIRPIGVESAGGRSLIADRKPFYLRLHRRPLPREEEKREKRREGNSEEGDGQGNSSLPASASGKSVSKEYLIALHRGPEERKREREGRSRLHSRFLFSFASLGSTSPTIQVQRGWKKRGIGRGTTPLKFLPSARVEKKPLLTL